MIDWTDPNNISVAALWLVALLFVWRVAAIVRRVNEGDMPSVEWPDDLRDLPMPDAKHRDYSGDRALVTWSRGRTDRRPLESTPIYDELVALLGGRP
jgi:hypothetical protein